MNHESAKHRSRAGEAYQQGGEAAEEMSDKSKGYRMHERGVRDIAAASVPLCTRGRRDWEGIASSRREGSSDGQIACWIDQGHSATEQKNTNKYQRDYSRSDKNVFKTEWGIRRIKDRWSLSMSLIG